MSKIEILVAVVDGVLFVLPDTARVAEYQRRRLRYAEDLEKKAAQYEETAKITTKRDPEILRREAAAFAEEAETARGYVAAVVEGAEKLIEKFGAAAQKLEFDFKPYTYGQKLIAQSANTSYIDGSPRLDAVRMQLQLTAVATGKTVEEIEGLAPAVAEALIREVVERTEPDPERLDFLS